MQLATVGVPTLHGIEDVSSRLGNTSPWTIRKHIAQGNIRVVRIGTRVFVNENEIERIQREGLPSLKVNEPRQSEKAPSTKVRRRRVPPTVKQAEKRGVS
jgi:hypothetical protein